MRASNLACAAVTLALSSVLPGCQPTPAPGPVGAGSSATGAPGGTAPAAGAAAPEPKTVTPAPGSPGKAGASAPTAAAPAAAPPATPTALAAKGSPAAPSAVAPPKSPASSQPAALTRLPSGLEYTTLREGSGNTPPLGSLVKVHAKGWRSNDQKVFLDTHKAGVPREYKLDSINLIKGWVETISAMKPGEIRRIHVPFALAYGVQGLNDDVPPRTDVDFEIELVSVTPRNSR